MQTTKGKWQQSDIYLAQWTELGWEEVDWIAVTMEGRWLSKLSWMGWTLCRLERWSFRCVSQRAKNKSMKIALPSLNYFETFEARNNLCLNLGWHLGDTVPHGSELGPFPSDSLLAPRKGWGKVDDSQLIHLTVTRHLRSAMVRWHNCAPAEHCITIDPIASDGMQRMKGWYGVVVRECLGIRLRPDSSLHSVVKLTHSAILCISTLK